MRSLHLLLQEAEINLRSNAYQKAFESIELALDSGASPNHISPLVIKYFNLRQLDVAAKLAEAALRRYPENYDLLNTFGVVLKNQTHYDKAISVLKQAASVNPNEAMAWINIGNIYMIIGDQQTALQCFTQAVSVSPKHAEAMRLQASAHIKLGDSGMAEAILRKAIIIDPKNATIMADLSAACYNQKLYDQAYEYADRCLSLSPNDMSLLKRKGMILRQLGRTYESIPIWERVREFNPGDIGNLLALGHGYHSVMGDSMRAKECYDMAYKVDPTNIEVLQRLCELMLSIKEYDGSQDKFISKAYEYAEQMLVNCKSVKDIAAIIQMLSLKILDYDMYDKLGGQKELVDYWVGLSDSRPFVYQLSRVKTIEDRLHLLEGHRVCGAAVEKNSAGELKITKVRQRFNNKTRIGIMSSDLRRHPVGYFAWPLIENLDRDKFELYCYSFFPYEIDDVQRDVMSRVDSFKAYRQENDFLVAESIANDHLDILFELGGRTLFSKTDACAYKPAPLQVSWLGYPHSIGFPTAIDYILVDPYINPENPKLLLEKPFIMPKTWVAIDKVGFLELPIDAVIPEDRNNCLTFGTVNASHKLTLETFAVWAEIMKAVPGSRFLYVRPEADSAILKSNFRKHMLRHGISPDRISFAATHTDHMKFYNEIDIALDTFPHTGGTTTCEALWMGVPVVTLVGPAFFERLSYSNLTNARLSDLCAFNHREYIDIALDLARDKERRRFLRHGLRQQIRMHPLGQPQQFAYDFSKTVLDVLGKV